MTIQPTSLVFVVVLACLVFFSSLGAGAAEDFSIQVGEYPSLEGALKVLDALKDNRIYCDTQQKGNVFTVECGPFSTEEDAKGAQEKLAALGYKESLIARPVRAIKDLTAEKEQAKEAPVGTEKKGEIFDKKGGNLHPFLSVAEYYTDNVFNTNDNKQGDFYTVVSAGIWFLVPRAREYLTDITLNTVSPGGLQLTRFVERYPGRYQTYFLYRADIEQHSRFSSENTVNQTALGAFQYNFGGGLSVNLADQYVKSHDPRGTGDTSILNKYHANLADAILSYETNTKWKFRVDYSNFLVKYLDPQNDFRNRTDNSVSAYAFYKILPKTSVFVEYDFVNIAYKVASTSNSTEHHLLGGVSWEIAAKTKGAIKMGYSVKNFSDPAIPDGKIFMAEAQIDYRLTQRTSLNLVVGRKMNETDIEQTDFVVSDYVSAGYLQRFTKKVSASANLSYSRDKYQGDLTVGNETEQLRDSYYGASVIGDYQFREWLKASLGYSYTRRVSTFSEFDYTNNTLYFKLTGSL